MKGMDEQTRLRRIDFHSKLHEKYFIPAGLFPLLLLLFGTMVILAFDLEAVLPYLFYFALAWWFALSPLVVGNMLYARWKYHAAFEYPDYL